MALIRTQLETLAYSALEDSDVTNPDRKTIAHHVQCLADQIAQLCDEYVLEAEVEAARDESERDQAAYEWYLEHREC
jgi:hypothetical protein